MSENETPGSPPPGPPHPGGWQPLPQGGEYDAEATAFVQLPEGLTDFDDPLAAPGHDYVPPQITVGPGAETDPGATGSWTAPSASGEMRWPEPQSAPDPASTGQWSYDAPPTPAAASELTGQWTIPVAGGDLPDESGEFTTSALAAQWGAAQAPATLPGGARAPWAPEPEQPAPHSEHDASPETGALSARRGGPSHALEAMGEFEDRGPGQSPGSGKGRVGEEPAPAPDAEPTQDEPAPAQEPEPEPAGPDPAHSDHPHASYVLRVNGTDRPVTEAWIGESLLYVLRERLGLAGAKDGCSQGECGACAVQVDGRLVASCLVPAATTAGSEVRTVEGLATDGEPSDVQRALANCGAVQCGFCVPGMAMTVHDLLEGNHAPSELETRQALCGNLCRCSGYRGVLEAVRDVVAEREATAAAEEARIPHQAPPGAGGVQQPHPHDGGMA